MDNLLTRTRMLLGDEKVDLLRTKTVLIAGLGGVGGTALECLARSGIEHFILIDDDVVNLTNLNRQILFLESDVGKSKTEVAYQRLKAINPAIEAQLIKQRIYPESFELLDGLTFDFVVDAIDSVPGKATLIEVALKHHVPLIISLGMAKRLDPQAVITTRLGKTHHDPLAKSLRNLLRKKDINPDDIACVFSTEEALNHEWTPASMMMVPSAAGLQLAAFTLKTLLESKETSKKEE